MNRKPAAGACLILLLVSGCGTQPTVVEPARAKNVILFIGDGMGISTVTAARIFDGQSRGLKGEEHVLAFERFPNVALSKTYNTNQQVPDSAGTATAMLTGHKTRAGVINVAPGARRGDCHAALAQPLEPLGKIAKRNGMAVGFATTTRVTHATPATVYAHSPERNWEADSAVPLVAREAGCRDIAWQLLHAAPGDELDVAMGGGARNFFGANANGYRLEPGTDLINDWLAAGAGRRYVANAAQLAALPPGGPVLGLFAESHLAYVAERTATSTEPTLSQMTASAIDLLAAAGNGYFLMIEGGRIDHGHHEGKPGYAMLEAQAFNRAIETALAKVDLSETLVIVTADHSHVFTLGGYPTRGNPILGLVVKNDDSGEPRAAPDLAADGTPYTTLAYANGPGAVASLPRPVPGTGIDAVAQALVPLEYFDDDGTSWLIESHAGEDVAVYATGAGAQRVRGVIEQSQIFTVMTKALGWE